MCEFENIYNIIKELHPLIFEYHKKWFTESYKICKNLLKYNNSEISNIFIVQYFINNFNEEHTTIKIRFPDNLKLKYTGFFAFYNGTDLRVTQIHDDINKIKTGDIITKINKMPYIEYINEFMCFHGGVQNDIMDIKYQSNFICINYGNPFMKKPINITLNDGNDIILKYIDYNLNMNVLDFFMFDIIDNTYKLYKKEDHIHIQIPDFDNIMYDDLKKMLPCKEITVNLKNNLGGSIFNVEKFFYILYGIDIKTGIFVKLNKYTNNYSKLKKLKNKSYYCRETTMHKYKNITNKLKINVLVNEYSKSASKLFVNIIKSITDNYKIYGEINTSDICGTVITIITSEYELNIPTMCFSLSCCKKKELNIDDI